MALITIDAALEKALRHLAKGINGTGVQICSYKRNRFLVVVKVSGDRFFIEEHGYYPQSLHLEARQLNKWLRQAFKREFPRSRKVRLIYLGPTEHPRVDLKRL